MEHEGRRMPEALESLHSADPSIREAVLRAAKEQLLSGAPSVEGYAPDARIRALRLIDNLLGEEEEAQRDIPDNQDNRRFTVRHVLPVPAKIPYNSPLPFLDSSSSAEDPEEGITMNVQQIFADVRTLVISALQSKHGKREVLSMLTIEEKTDYEAECLKIFENIERVFKELERSVSRFTTVIDHLALGTAFKHQYVQLIFDALYGYFDKLQLKLDKYRDPNTGLLTAEFLKIYLRKVLEQKVPVALLRFDLKGLGGYNEAYGTQLTNEILKIFFHKMAGAHGSRVTDAHILPPGRDPERPPAEGDAKDLDDAFRQQAGGDEGREALVGVETIADLEKAMKRIYASLDNKIMLPLSADDLSAMQRRLNKLNKKIAENPKGMEGLNTKEKEAWRILALKVEDLYEDLEAGRPLFVEISLEMRFGGIILDPNSEGFQYDYDAIDSSSQHLEELAKVIQAEGFRTEKDSEDYVEAKNPLVLLKDGKYYWTAANDLGAFGDLPDHYLQASEEID